MKKNWTLVGKFSSTEKQSTVQAARAMDYWAHIRRYLREKKYISNGYGLRKMTQHFR